MAPRGRIFSPVKCGGLIEATSIPPNGAGCGGRFSPVKCGGLIEADLPGSGSLRSVRIFPREMRGPH